MPPCSRSWISCLPRKGVSRERVKGTDFVSWLRAASDLLSTWIPWPGLKTWPFLSRVNHFAMLSAFQGAAGARSWGFLRAAPSLIRAGLHGTCPLSLLQAIGQRPCAVTDCRPPTGFCTGDVQSQVSCCSDPQWLYLSCPLPTHGDSGLGLAL